MSCPFLREAPVKYCGTSAVRKLIPMAASGRSEEKCTSDRHAECSVFRAQPETPAAGACPFLRESLMQYCAAAPLSKMVPYCEPLLSRCGDRRFRYCESYLAMARRGVEQEAGGVTLPARLSYSTNHMWLDSSPDGACHAGIDAFLARVLGSVEQLSYVWQQGDQRPAAILTVAGMNLEVVFPNRLRITGCNLYLRANPGRLTSDPYASGWLFEGTPEPPTGDDLLSGEDARHWMEDEQERMNGFLRAHVDSLLPALTENGKFVAGLVQHLDRHDVAALFHEFFSPYQRERERF